MDDDMQKYLIPRYLDEPAKVLIFTMDEIAAIVVCGLAGLYLAHFLPGVLAGLGLVAALRRLKRGGGINILLYLAYWRLPPAFGRGVLGLRATPPSCARLFAG